MLILSLVNLKLANTQRTLELCEMCLPLAVSIGDRKLEARTITLMGRVHLALAPARSLRHFEQSIAIAKEAKDRSIEAWATLYLGEAHRALREDAKTLMLLEHASAIASQLGIVALQCRVLLAKGVHYFHAGEIIKAIGILLEGGVWKFRAIIIRTSVSRTQILKLIRIFDRNTRVVGGGTQNCTQSKHQGL